MNDAISKTICRDQNTPSGLDFRLPLEAISHRPGRDEKSVFTGICRVETDSKAVLQVARPSATERDPASLSLTGFVQSRFIPEFVANKRSAGRDHFKAILKHVLSPDEVSRIFASSSGAKSKLTSIPGWPYIGSMRLSEIDAGTVQRLTSAAVDRGYSTQTVTHLRNVIRSIFSHAIRTGYYREQNPAACITIPKIPRRTECCLTLAQLRGVLTTMKYPEKEFALIAMFTDMNVAQICGLQWKYVNLFNSSRVVDQEVIPPCTVAVRRQSYRGVLSTVTRSRKRLVPLPAAFVAYLNDLKLKSRFVGPQDFVLVSRNGNPLHPGNINARRLKVIGNLLGIPSLSWAVLLRTRRTLRAKLGEALYEQVGDILAIPMEAHFISNHTAPKGRVWA